MGDRDPGREGQGHDSLWKVREGTGSEARGGPGVSRPPFPAHAARLRAHDLRELRPGVTVMGLPAASSAGHPASVFPITAGPLLPSTPAQPTEKAAWGQG